MRILITGAAGQLGRELLSGLGGAGDILATTRDGAVVDGHETTSMDLSLPLRIQEVMQEFKPHVVINTAAFTAVDDAEEETELAHQFNTVAPGVIAVEAGSVGALMIHFSTDFVFSGAASRPWRETDPTVALNVYGHTKLGGEGAVRQSGVAHLILRTGWVYSAHGHNFLNTMLHLARERDELKVVDDQSGAPTWTRSLTDAVATLLNRFKADGRTPAEALGRRGGTYHLTAAGETTWFQYAMTIFQLAFEAGLIEGKPRVEPTNSAVFAAKARRPAYSVLDNSRIRKAFSVTMPAWQDDLAQCIQQIEKDALC